MTTVPEQAGLAARGAEAISRGAAAKRHGMEATPVLQELGVVLENGLNADEARNRLQTHGPNRLAGTKKESGSIVFDQAENRMHTINAVIVATLGD